MKGMTRFQVTALARLLANHLSGARMKVDARSLTALQRRGLVEYCGEMGRRGMDNELMQIQAFSGKTARPTSEGVFMLSVSEELDREVEMHLRLERDRALERASSYEATARMLRRRAAKWSEALERRLEFLPND